MLTVFLSVIFCPDICCVCPDIFASYSEHGSFSTLRYSRTVSFLSMFIMRDVCIGCLIVYNGDIIHWFSRRQKLVVLSSAEAEYVALGETAKELMWCRN